MKLFLLSAVLVLALIGIAIADCTVQRDEALLVRQVTQKACDIWLLRVIDSSGIAQQIYVDSGTVCSVITTPMGLSKVVPCGEVLADATGEYITGSYLTSLTSLHTNGRMIACSYQKRVASN